LFKLVCRLKNGPTKDFLRRWRLYHPPLSRLAELSEGDAGSLEARSREFSEILEDVLINGVWKRTGAGRLVELDRWVASNVSRPVPEPFEMLDVGGSDGITTLDSLGALREILGTDVRATILELQFRIRAFRLGFLRYYTTSGGSPLMVQAGPFGLLLEEIKATEGALFNPVIRALKRRLERTRPERRMAGGGEILLENPRVADCGRIAWREQDLFRFDPGLAGSFDFVRCCNVLNRRYFEDSRIVEAVGLLSGYLKRDGLLLVSRTVDGEAGTRHAASLWRKGEGGLRHVADLNGGSEVRQLVGG
jgi:hypothetical protein